MFSFVRRSAGSLVAWVSRKRLVDHLRRSILVWLVPVALIAAALAGWSVLQIHRQQAAFVIEQARYVTKEIELDFERRQHGLKSIAALASAAEPSLDIVRWYRLSRTYDLVFGTPVALASDDRGILFNTRAPLGEPQDELSKPPGRSAFREALLTGDPQVSDVVFAPVLGRKVITAIVPISRTHALLGLVVLPEIQELLGRQAMPEGWSVSLFDGVGNLIAGSAERAPDPLDASIARRAVIRSSTTPLVVVVEASLWSFYRPHLEAGLTLLISIGLAFIGGASATHNASEGVLSSLRRLLGRQNRSEQGQAAVEKPPSPRIDEIEATDIELKRRRRNRYQIEESALAQIAHDLHDGVQQDATAAAMHLQVMKSQLDAAGALHQSASAALECVRRIIAGVSKLVQDLRPASAVAGGLASALHTCTEQFTALTGVHAELDILGEAPQVEGLPTPVVDCLHRVAQACLLNARQHADASLVHIELDVRSPAQVRMTVMDDGTFAVAEDGAAAAEAEVQKVADRVGALQGTLKASRGHDQSSRRGTTVIVTLPVLGG